MVSETTRDRVVTAIVNNYDGPKFSVYDDERVWSTTKQLEALQIYNTSTQNDPMSIAGDETTVLMYHCQCHVIAHRRRLVKPYDGVVNEEIQNSLL